MTWHYWGFLMCKLHVNINVQVPLLWAQQLFCTILKDVLNIARQEFDVNKRFPFGTIKLCLEDELLMLTVMWIQLCCQIKTV